MRQMAALLAGITVSCSLHAQDKDVRATFLEAVAARDLVAVEKALEADPTLVTAHRPNGTSAVTIALFTIVDGENFMNPPDNAVLQAILKRKPPLDIYETAAVGTAAQLESILKEDASAVTRRSRFGWTLLHVAAFGGNVPNTELLLRKGSVVESRAESRFRNTPLQTALLTSQYGTTKLLLDHGADPLVRQSKGFTPMHEAAIAGRLDLVQLLLDRGAEINSVADNGMTPLSEAIRGHHEELAIWMKGKGGVVGVQPDAETSEKK